MAQTIYNGEVVEKFIIANAADIGGGGGTVQEASAGPVAPATPALKSSLIGATFNTTPPTVANGQQAAVQMNNVGSLAITLRGSSSTAALDITGGNGTDALSGSGGKITSLSIGYAFDPAAGNYNRLRGDTIGLRTTPSTSVGTDRSAVVGAVSAVIIPANSARRSFFIYNDDVRDVYINWGGTATATIGNGNKRIGPGLGYESPAHCGAEAISAITSAGTASITVREY